MTRESDAAELYRWTFAARHDDHVIRERNSKGRYVATPLRERFERDVVRAPGCWGWVGSIDRQGYARLAYQGSIAHAHRLSYEMFVGPIPDGLTIDHLCRNPRCTNPEHLEPVTMRENILRSDNLCARNARKTHCHRGHVFDDANTIHLSGGRRDCRECRNSASRERRRLRRMAS